MYIYTCIIFSTYAVPFRDPTVSFWVNASILGPGRIYFLTSADVGLCDGMWSRATVLLVGQWEHQGQGSSSHFLRKKTDIALCLSHIYNLSQASLWNWRTGGCATLRFAAWALWHWRNSLKGGYGSKPKHVGKHLKMAGTTGSYGCVSPTKISDSQRFWLISSPVLADFRSSLALRVQIRKMCNLECQG